MPRNGQFPKKRVLSVGNCSMDHGTISAFLEQEFDVQVAASHGPQEALQALRQQQADLVLVNRVFDRDGDDGLEFIRSLKADPQLAQLSVMLISNFPEYQQQAVQAGARPGFGKRELHAPETIEKLRQALEA